MTLRLGGAQAALVAVLVAACAGGDGSEGGSGGASTTADPAVAALGDRVQRFLVSGNSHVAGRVEYPHAPPRGGDHSATWQNCGFYASPVVPALAVHSMEHGAVSVVFQPSLPEEQVATLRQLARRPYVLVSPWADGDIPSPVVASAWGLQLKADTASDPAVTAFVQAYANGPQTPERGARCTGAVGSPE